MNNYVIGESFTLPSNGEVYDFSVNPEIKLRSMTTNEEMKRLNRGERPYKVMADIIDDCLVIKPGISSYDMCIGDYQFLLHRLRSVTYGPEYSLACTCPLCMAVTEDIINIDAMGVNKFSPEIKKYLEFDLPRSKNHIEIRLQTPRMIDDVALQVKDFKKRAPNYVGDSAILFTVKNLIKTVDNERPNSLELEEWIQALPMMDTNYILKCAQKANDFIGVDTTLNVTCDVCGLDYTAPFRITSEFFGPSVQL